MKNNTDEPLTLGIATKFGQVRVPDPAEAIIMDSLTEFHQEENEKGNLAGASLHFVTGDGDGGRRRLVLRRGKRIAEDGVELAPLRFPFHPSVVITTYLTTSRGAGEEGRRTKSPYLAPLPPSPGNRDNSSFL